MIRTTSARATLHPGRTSPVAETRRVQVTAAKSASLVATRRTPPRRKLPRIRRRMELGMRARRTRRRLELRALGQRRRRLRHRAPDLRSRRRPQPPSLPKPLNLLFRRRPRHRVLGPRFHVSRERLRMVWDLQPAILARTWAAKPRVENRVKLWNRMRTGWRSHRGRSLLRPLPSLGNELRRERRLGWRLILA